MLLFLLQVWKAPWIYYSKLTNSQRARTPVFLVYFSQNAKANITFVNLRPAPLAYNNAYKKFLEQRCDIFLAILHSWRLRFLSQRASTCVPRSEKSCSAKLPNENSFKMDNILICTRWLVNQKAHCSRSITCREIQLCDTLTLVP